MEEIKDKSNVEEIKDKSSDIEEIKDKSSETKYIPNNDIKLIQDTENFRFVPDASKINDFDHDGFKCVQDTDGFKCVPDENGFKYVQDKNGFRYIPEKNIRFDSFNKLF